MTNALSTPAPSHVRYAVHGAVALLSADPLHALDRATRAALIEAIDRANTDPAVQAIVLGGTAAFAAAAGLDDAALQPDALAVAAVVEDSRRPVVAAMAGACTGAGFEVALAAHYRVADRAAQLSLPAIQLGLLPAAGGTQRLPRLIGLETSLDLMLTGKPVPVAGFAGTALCDEMVDGDPVEAALALARRVASQPPPRVRDRRVADPQREAFLQFCRSSVASRGRRAPAALQCVELVAASAARSFDEGMALEAQTFAALWASPVSRGLRHLARAVPLAARCTSADAVSAAPCPVPRIGVVGVVGAGTMGSGIATAFANAGLSVVLLDADQAALDRGMQAIARNYAGALQRGQLTQGEVDARIALVWPSLSYAALAEADLVIEAVFERLDVKEAVLRQLDAVVRPGAIIASNTSALDLDVLAGYTRRPQDVVGLHFFSPAHVMRLLEVVRGRDTSDAVLSAVLALAARIGKVAVVARVCDGFIGNRMLARYVAAADQLVRQGALPQQVDGALERFGFAMGPFRMGDLAGLDIAQAGRKRRAAAQPERDFSMVADVLCEAGRLGQKTGAGWYRYEPGRRDALPDPVVAQLLAAWRQRHGIAPREVGEQEIVEQCVLALVNEGARVLEQGIAQRASDIDVVYVNGYGFPADRGGPMHYAGALGLPQTVRALDRLAARPGSDPCWVPAPLLRRLAAAGQSFDTSDQETNP